MNGTIIIAGEEWSIRFRRRIPPVDGAPVWGVCDTEQRSITVRINHPTENSLLATLIHEAIHAAMPRAAERDVALAGQAAADAVCEYVRLKQRKGKK